MMRTFVALEIPEEIKLDLSLLKSNIWGARWIPVEQIHLTLTFNGSIGQNTFCLIKKILGEIIYPSFSLQLKGVGHFSSKSGPKILWAGIKESEDLKGLKKEIDRRLKEEQIDLEKKAYRPHVTLARIKGGSFSEVAQYLQEKALFVSQEFKVEEFVLVSSRLGPQGPQYQIEEHYFLN